MADKDPFVVAIAADHAVDGQGLPVFVLDDIAGIADFISRAVGPFGVEAGLASAAREERAKHKTEPQTE
jgi:molybdopterin-guanine dinucleotide biosynthesis protein B